MAAADVQQPPAEPAAPAVPDYLASPNAVFSDPGVEWRYGKAPDYSKTRKVWEEGKKMNHAAGSLPQLVENLVKNWEVEASFKPRLQDWRTIDHKNYTFAINGGPPQTAEHMLKVGTYNAIIAPNEYYSPENSDFASSHKTFKRMMPTFAWEVIEVYSGPPRVAFKWRHWGVMKNDYVGFNDKGEKITAKAHGGPIDIEGVTVAQVDDAVRLQSVETWFDPLEMFRQIAPGGVVNKEIMDHRVDKSDALDPTVPNNDGIKIAEAHNKPGAEPTAPEEVIPKHISNSTGQPADAFVPHQGADTDKPASSDPVTAQAAASTPQTEARSGATTEEPIDTTETAEPTTTTVIRPANQSGAANGGGQSIVETAATQGAEMPISKPESNFQDAVEQSGSKSPSESGSSDKTWEKVEKPETSSTDRAADGVKRSIYSSAVTGNEEDVLKAAKDPNFVDESVATGVHDAIDQHLESSAEQVHPHPKDMEEAVKPEAGEAVAAAPDSEEVRMTHEEMSKITAAECPFLMNRE